MGRVAKPVPILLARNWPTSSMVVLTEEPPVPLTILTGFLASLTDPRESCEWLEIRRAERGSDVSLLGAEQGERYEVCLSSGRETRERIQP